MIAVDNGNPPFMYAAGNDPKGLYPRIVSQLFSNIKVPVQVIPLPWKRALKEAENGTLGIAGIYKTAQRQSTFDYSAEIYQEQIYIYTLKANNFSFRTLRDLENRRIGVLRGWSYGDEFDTFRNKGLFSIEESNRDEQNFQLLAMQRIDCLLAIGESGDLYLKNEEYQNQISRAEPALVTNPTYIVFPKQQQQTELLKKINLELQQMRMSGTYQKLLDNFFAEWHR